MGAMTVLGALALVAAACDGSFDGPYACAPGYASCGSGQTSGSSDVGNQCETNTTRDALHCGACGVTCDVGAPCVASVCSAPPPVVTHLPPESSPSTVNLATNSTAVFFGDPSTQSISMVPLAGGAAQAVVSSSAGIASCGSGLTFAVDDAYLYYFASQPSPNGPSVLGLRRHALANGAESWVVAPGAATGLTCNGGLSLAVDATSAYFAASQGSGSGQSYQLFKAPIAGGAPTVLASAQGTNGGSTQLAVTPTSIVFDPPGDPNSPGALAVVPLGGGAVRTLSAQVNDGTGGSYGVSVFAANATDAFAVGSGCPCGSGNGNGNASGPLQLTVARLPLDGTPGSVIARLDGEALAAAVDATSIYVLTEAALWRVPLAGGDPTSLAGNLANGYAARCNGSCGGGSGTGPTPGALASAASSVFVADSYTSVGALFEVAK
jgi:hypothetical protein